LFCPITAEADEKEMVTPYEDFTVMRMTCYCNEGVTADGTKVRKGICAMSTEYLGKTALVFTVTENGKPGTLIGIYEVKDTGYGTLDETTGLGTIEAGKCIDIWMPEDEINNFISTWGDYCCVVLIDGVG
jgi:hypothetical protein